MQLQPALNLRCKLWNDVLDFNLRKYFPFDLHWRQTGQPLLASSAPQPRFCSAFTLVISVWFLKQVIQHKHTWPDLTSPDLAGLGIFKVGPRPDLKYANGRDATGVVNWGVVSWFGSLCRESGVSFGRNGPPYRIRYNLYITPDLFEVIEFRDRLNLSTTVFSETPV